MTSSPTNGKRRNPEHRLKRPRAEEPVGSHYSHHSSSNSKRPFHPHSPSRSTRSIPASSSSASSSAPSSSTVVAREEARKRYPVFSADYATRFTRDNVPFLRDNMAIPAVDALNGLPPRPLSPLLRQPRPLPHLHTSTSSPPAALAPRWIVYNEYLVLRELGKGTYAKVVLCRSLRTGEELALKIFRSDSNYAAACYDEVGVFDTLCQPVGQTLGCHVPRQTASDGSAECQGRLGRFIVPIAHLPHVSHHAIVLPVLGPSLLDVLKNIRRCAKSGSSGSERRAREVLLHHGIMEVTERGMPMYLLRAVLYQLLLFLRHAHRRGVAHTDLKPENVLFESMDMMPTRLSVVTRRISRPVCETGTNNHKNNHNYSKRCQIDNTHVKMDLDTRVECVEAVLPVMNAVRVIDLGAAEFLNKCHHVSPIDGVTPVSFERIQTTHYRSPEVLLGIGWNASADLWSLGCMIPELLTGNCIFMPRDNLEHLALMRHIIGPFELTDHGDKSILRHIFSKGRLFCKYFDAQSMDLLWPQSSSSSSRRNAMEEDLAYVASQPTLREVLGPHPQLFDLCCRLLDYDPIRRISAEEALRHPFFTTSTETV